MAKYDYRYATPTFPGTDAVAAEPSDAIEYDPPFRALYVGESGDVVITTLAGRTATFKRVPQGMILPVAGTCVRGITSASDITAIF